MPRQKGTSEWKTDSRGRYRRMVGWKEEGGRRVQQPFYFGIDLDLAKARYLRVKELWAHLERTHEQSLLELNSRFELPERTECRWTTESLWIARELAAGRVQVSVPPPDGLHPSSYVSRIDGLAKSYPMVYFVPEDPQAYREGEGFWKGRHRAPAGEAPAPADERRPSGIPDAPRGPRRLHRARQEVGPGADPPRPAADLLRPPEGRAGPPHQGPPGRPSTLHARPPGLPGTHRLPADAPADRGDPEAARRPMEARYCENHIAELSRFFKWLHKSKGFDWREPEDFDDLETKVKDLPEERTGIGFLNVEVFRFGEVFRALRQLGRDLQPVFDAAPSDPREAPMQQYTSLGVREQILELDRQGVKAPAIARRLGKSPMTVYRLVERRASKSKAE